MALFDRVSRVVRANINDLVSKSEDPTKILEQSFLDMQESLIRLRQTVELGIANQQHLEQ